MARIVTIFGSSKPVAEDPEYQIALTLGKLLAQAGFTVCNGGYGGIMEASARGAKEAGGSTIGVITEIFSPTANRFIDKSILLPTLIERMMKLIELGDGYVVLPGGTGTLLEFAAVWEFLNKQLMKPKPLVVLGDFWSPVVALIKSQLVREASGHFDQFIHIAATPAECISLLARGLPSPLRRG